MHVFACGAGVVGAAVGSWVAGAAVVAGASAVLAAGAVVGAAVVGGVYSARRQLV